MITEYDLPGGALPSGIVTGPDQAIWFTAVAANTGPKDEIMRLQLSPSSGSLP